MLKAYYVYVPTGEKLPVKDTLEFPEGASVTDVIDAVLQKVGHIKFYIRASVFVERISWEHWKTSRAKDGIDIVVVSGGQGIP